MKTMLRPTVMGLAVAGVLGGAWAMAATAPIQIPIQKTCLHRGVPNINRIQVGVGGDVVCLAYAGAPLKLQYDTYYYAYGFRFYSHTVFESCEAAQSSDPPAYAKFC